MSESWVRRHPYLVVVGVFGSFLLSAWALHISGVVNNDGVYYILSAERFAAGEWRNAFVAFKWPTYSFLIYLLNAVSGLSFETAAYAITATGFALAVLGFVSAVHALGGRGRVLWLALLTVLAYPGINDLRDLLIRDALFLALYLFALSALFRYMATRAAIHLARTGILLLVAALFRVEALAIAMLLPLFLVVRYRGWRRSTFVILAYALVFLPLLGMFYGWWIYRPVDGEGALTIPDQPWRLIERALNQVIGDLTHRFGDLGAAGAVSAFRSASWLVVRETVKAITLPYLLIIIFELSRRRLTRGFAPEVAPLLGALTVLHLLVLFVFALAMSFLAQRYPVALAVTLVLAVPFAVERYLNALPRLSSAMRRRAAMGVLIFLFAVNLADGLDNFSDKFYLRDGGLWLRNHGQAELEPHMGAFRLATNDLRVAYYADRHAEKWVVFRDDFRFRRFLLTEQWKFKDFVAVNVKHREPELEFVAYAALRQAPILQFDSTNGDKLLIFYTGND